jgi:hypothetical protein
MINPTELAQQVRSATSARNAQDAAAAEQLAANLLRLQQKLDSLITRGPYLIDKKAGMRSEAVITPAIEVPSTEDEQVTVEEALDEITGETESVFGGERLLIWQYLGRGWSERIVSIAKCVPVASA